MNAPGAETLQRDPMEALRATAGKAAMRFLREQAEEFRAAGLFEQSVAALCDTRFCIPDGLHDEFLDLVDACDRDRLRSVGSPLPGPGPFRLFRGVHGTGRVRGFYWSDRPEIGLMYAMAPSRKTGGRIPTIYQAEAPRSAVLLCVSLGREFVADPRMLRKVRPYRPTQRDLRTMMDLIDKSVAELVAPPGVAQ